jgi:hypothetical protein
MSYAFEHFILFGSCNAGLGSRSRLFGSLEQEPLKKTGAALKKNQELEPLKIELAHQPCEKIKSIRKLYFSYS